MKTLQALAEWMAPRAKAVAAGVGAAVLMFKSALADGVTIGEWVEIVSTALAVAVATYAVPNGAKPAAVRPSRNGTQP